MINKNLVKLMFSAVLVLGTCSANGMDDEKKTCQESLLGSNRGGGKNIHNVTVIKIGFKKVYYKKCDSDKMRSIHKDNILAVKYGNGKMDKFDFTGKTNKKKGMGLVRSKKSVEKRRNE